MSKYGVFSGSYFPAFALNTGKYGLEKTQYLDTFHTVNQIIQFDLFFSSSYWEILASQKRALPIIDVNDKIENEFYSSGKNLEKISNKLPKPINI